MRTEHIRTASILVFSAVVTTAGIVIVRQSMRLQACAEQHTRDLSSLDGLRAALRQQPAQSPAPAATPEDSRAPARGCAGTQQNADPAAGEAAERLNRQLEEAHAGVARLQGQLENSERERKTASTALETLQGREQDWRDRVEALERQLNSARGEAEGAQASRERAASLEAENARVRNESGAASARIAELRKAMAGLRDLDRRRDVYLDSIIRRYRDVAQQLRAMTGVIDSSRASGSSSISDVLVSRIQNATSAAEDDLRRLNELNAQAHQIENRLAKN